MSHKLTAQELTELIRAKLSHQLGVQPKDATNEHYYKAAALVIRDIVQEHRKEFHDRTNEQEGKQVYYLCMEFLMGRSLKNNLYNLGIEEAMKKALQSFDVKLSSLYELEPDAGLGNGGLGRLAACFLDGLASGEYPAMGYSLRYEFGIFQQKIVDGWQTELPDSWLPGGDIWLVKRPEWTVPIKFGGHVQESWDGAYHHVDQVDYDCVQAVPYDMYAPGLDGKGVSVLRLWSATAPGLDMNLFNQGDYMRAVEQNAMAEVITKVLYPSDNHREGKSLRLKQQYFLVSSSIQDIIRRHLEKYHTIENLPDKVAIHINDTHPALAIPELMRIMLDECGMTWEHAWSLVTQTIAYTNHTVMSEALEVWPEDLFQSLLPRIHQIVQEINRRASEELMEKTGGNREKVSDMAVISYGMVKMANLSVIGSHSVNGVSRLHSEIVKDT
ncbi:MAG: glycogen/starch/alpha-glucan phosphorylase, partial [Clostridiales bacterium]|nr:glycogen/starch/alpha-glucan phosphorylase [Clostridiales bacterium]